MKNNGLEIEAFAHAAAANDLERAERLMEGNGMPLQFRGAMIPVMNWLESLPAELMNARPSLWVAYASTLTMVGKPVDSIEEILQLLKPPYKTPNQTKRIEISSVMLPLFGQ